MLIRSMEDLAKVKQKALEQQNIHAGKCNFHVRIGTASCGVAVGALETLDAIKQLVAEKKLEDICIKQVGCTGLCALEPLVQVQQVGYPLVTYGRVTPEVARRIVEQHIQKGLVVQEYVIESVLEPDMGRIVGD